MKLFRLFLLLGISLTFLSGCQNTSGTESTQETTEEIPAKTEFKDSLADAFQSMNEPVQKKVIPFFENEGELEMSDIVYDGKRVDLEQFRNRPLITNNPLRRAKIFNFAWENEIVVHTLEEFIQALGSNRTIIVSPGIYIFRDVDVGVGGIDNPKAEALDHLSEFYDNSTIHDVNNLTIIGKGKFPPAFLQPDGYSHVMRFQNCRNVYLNNLILGHHPEAGWCMGGVLFAQNCEQMRIENTVLFGSGTEGLSLITVEDFTLSYSWITQCTEQFSSFSHVRNVILDNSLISNNSPELRGFAIFDAEVLFRNTEIDQPEIEFHYDRKEYTDAYNEFFVLDDYDYAEWYADLEDIKLIEPKLEASIIKFEDCTLNHQPIDGEIL